jgi:hypothetical protein
MDWCRCCEEQHPGWELRALPLRRYRAWRTAGPGLEQAIAVCEGCARWLAGLVLESRGDGAGRLFGQPGANGRHLVFEDQCAACCESPASDAFALRWLRAGEPAGDLFLCIACARWLLGLAGSGRTVRGRAERHLDGRYGLWPHPRLRGLRLWAAVRDRGGRAVVERVIATLGLVTAESAAEADAVFIEGTTSGAARTFCRQLGDAARKVVVLAGMGAQQDLAGALEAGAHGWVTLPATPQQLTAALARLARGERAAAWDPVSCLPLLRAGGFDRPWLWVPVEDDGQAWQGAWLLRRFCRGYDTVAAAPGGLAVVPVAPPAVVGHVASRLRMVLGPAWRVETRQPLDAGMRRFEAAG